MTTIGFEPIVIDNLYRYLSYIGIIYCSIFTAVRVWESYLFYISKTVIFHE